MYDFKNIFAENNCEKLAFLTQNTAKLCKRYYGKLSREKVSPEKVSPKNCRLPNCRLRQIVAYGKLSPFYNIGRP
jgi:hypothetical protein